MSSPCSRLRSRGNNMWGCKLRHTRVYHLAAEFRRFNGDAYYETYGDRHEEILMRAMPEHGCKAWLPDAPILPRAEAHDDGAALRANPCY